MSPIFLVGSERSGTTLLRLMLDHHPEITFLREFDYCVTHLPPDSGFPEMDEYLEWLNTQFLFCQELFEVDKSLEYASLLNDFLNQANEKNGSKAIIGATVHHNFDWLPRVWPTAKYIHIIRDGRDVARSAIDMGWAGNVWAGSAIWIEAERAWQRLVASINTEDYIEIYYQDLIRNPVSQLTTICQFMGLLYSSRMIEYSKNSTYDPPNEKMLEQWRHKLTPYELQSVESRIATLLVEHNFALSGYPLIKLSTIEQKILTVQSWIGICRFRVRRFGLFTFLVDFMARRAPFCGWLKAWSRNKIWSVNAKHLK